MSATTEQPQANPDTDGADAQVELVRAPPILPATSFRAAAPFLRRPYEANAVRWKPQSLYPRDGAVRGAIIVCYIDRGLVIDRLNVVVPDLWDARFEDLGHGGLMQCALTVDGITRVDVGEAASLKARYSDSLKRAAVHFGVGVSLSRVPQSRLTVESGMLRTWGEGKGRGAQVTQKGLDYLRARYEDWLDVAGRAVFGDPLAHGDIGEAQGDDADDSPVADHGETSGLHDRLAGGEFTVRQQAGFLKAAGLKLPGAPTGQDIADATSVLTGEQAAKLAELLDAAKGAK